MGMTTSLSSNENIARGSWSKTFVSRTKIFLPPFALLPASFLSLPADGAVAFDDDDGGDDGLFDEDFFARCCIPCDPTETGVGAIDAGGELGRLQRTVGSGAVLDPSQPPT